MYTKGDKFEVNFDKFQTISLLNVEGKLFFADLAKRVTSFLTDKK